MVKKAVLPLLIFVLAPAFLWAESREAAYVTARDGLIRHCEKAIVPVDERLALAGLEKELQTIVGSVKIKGFPAPGSINLITLLRDNAGFDQLDGLRYDSGEEILVVTTESLLMSYVSDHPTLPRTLRKLSELGDFYRRAFHADAGVICYAEVPVEKRKGQSFVRAFLGVSAQDIAPIVPDELFVFVSAGPYVLLVNAPAAAEIPDIGKCRKEWDRWKKKSVDAYEIYRSSKFTNTRAFEDSRRYEGEGFEAYCRCFEREAKDRTFFPSLVAQAQSIVDRLLR